MTKQNARAAAAAIRAFLRANDIHVKRGMRFPLTMSMENLLTEYQSIHDSFPITHCTGVRFTITFTVPVQPKWRRRR